MYFRQHPRIDGGVYANTSDRIRKGSRPAFDRDAPPQSGGLYHGKGA